MGKIDIKAEARRITEEMILSDIVSAAWKVEPDIPASQWIEENVVFGPDADIPGLVSFDLVPMSRFVVDSFQDRSKRSITLQVAAQCAKTKTAEFCAIWKLRNRPGHSAWYLDSQEKAKSFWKTRFKADFENCPAVAHLVPHSRDRLTNKLVQFANMDLHILSAVTSSARESISVGTVFLDEWRKYPPGAATQIRNRFKSIRNWQFFGFSTAGDLNCELDLSFREGSQHLWFWDCPECGHAQTFRFGRDATTLHPKPRECGGFVWETNERTKPGENAWDWEELAKTVRYECENPACRHRFADHEKFRLYSTLRPIQTNPLAPSDQISCHWWEAYMPWPECAWPEIVKKFLKARVAQKQGDLAPLRVFVTETLGESWEPPGGEKIEKGDLDACVGTHSIGEFRIIDQSRADHLREARIITVDNQQGFIVYCLRQVIVDTETRSIESRLVDVGNLLGFQELRLFQESRKVANAWVFIDCAYKPDEVKRACRDHGSWAGSRHEPIWNGWNPVRGHKAANFQVTNQGVRMRQHWKQDVERTGDGREILVYSFSKSHYRETLFVSNIRARAGEVKEAASPEKLPPHWWTVAANAPDEYFAQMQNVTRVPTVDAAGQITGYEWKEKGRHDIPDTEQMQMAALDIGGIWKQIR